MLYPIGIQSFSEIRQHGYVYVDKTALMYKRELQNIPSLPVNQAQGHVLLADYYQRVRFLSAELKPAG